MTVSADQGSITRLMHKVRAGDRDAANPLWDRYFSSLVGLARTKLRTTRRADADEEDAALSAMWSFFEGLGGGKYPMLSDRNDLWRLLAKITARKALDRIAYLKAKRRGEKLRLDEAELNSLLKQEHGALAMLAGKEPDPAVASLLAEEFQSRLELLGKPALRQIAMLRMDGYGHAEIAQIVGCCERSVSSKLELIRKTWCRDDTPA